jgi:hypothetical protein
LEITYVGFSTYRLNRSNYDNYVQDEDQKRYLNKTQRLTLWVECVRDRIWDKMEN